MTGLLLAAGGACLVVFVASFWVGTLLDARRAERDSEMARHVRFVAALTASTAARR